MTDRPILFTGEMVRAILAGRKTQTRRMMKPQPEGTSQDTGLGPPGALMFKTGPWTYDGVSGPPLLARCPYGQPGDRLWVRETFLYCNNKQAVLLKADLSDFDAAGIGGLYGGWKPSIHMPKKFCRLRLELTEVRVERLQEISRGPSSCAGGGRRRDRTGMRGITRAAQLCRGKRRSR